MQGIGLAACGAIIMVASAGVGVGVRAPEITVSTWLNSPRIAVGDLRGKVVLVEFWTFGCYNCRNVEPHVKEWHRKYAERGLVVIGVHTPETAYERDVDNVRHYVHDHQLSYAVAIDGDSTTWEHYGNHAWPAWYLIDKRGVIRHVHVGEGAYAETEREIEALLAEQSEEKNATQSREGAKIFSAAFVTRSIRERQTSWRRGRQDAGRDQARCVALGELGAA